MNTNKEQLPPLPWIIEVNRNGGRNPVTSIGVVAEDGVQVFNWFANDEKEVEELKSRARFLINIVEDFYKNRGD